MTRQCLSLSLADCSREEQSTIIATFREVECLALDICTTGEEDPPEIDGTPELCIDPAVVSDETVCELEIAYECMRTFENVFRDPFNAEEAFACL